MTIMKYYTIMKQYTIKSNINLETPIEEAYEDVFVEQNIEGFRYIVTDMSEDRVIDPLDLVNIIDVIQLLLNIEYNAQWQIMRYYGNGDWQTAYDQRMMKVFSDNIDKTIDPLVKFLQQELMKQGVNIATPVPENRLYPSPEETLCYLIGMEYYENESLLTDELKKRIRDDICTFFKDIRRESENNDIELFTSEYVDFRPLRPFDMFKFKQSCDGYIQIVKVPSVQGPDGIYRLVEPIFSKSTLFKNKGDRYGRVQWGKIIGPLELLAQIEIVKPLLPPVKKPWWEQ